MKYFIKGKDRPYFLSLNSKCVFIAMNSLRTIDF